MGTLCWPQGAVRNKPGLVPAFWGAKFPKDYWVGVLAGGQERLPGRSDLEMELERVSKSQLAPGG